MAMKSKSGSVNIPLIGKVTVKKTTDSNNYKDTRMTGVVYGKGDKNIPKEREVTRTSPINGVRTVKTKTYGPTDYYGKQSSITTKRMEVPAGKTVSGKLAEKVNRVNSAFIKKTSK